MLEFTSNSSAYLAHQRAEAARENADYQIALGLYLIALFHYDHTPPGVAARSEVLAGMSIFYRHLASTSADTSTSAGWLGLARQATEESLMLATEAAERGESSAFAMALFNAAKIAEQQADWPTAIERYSKAIEAFNNYPPPQHHRPAVQADFQLKLELAKLLSGTTDRAAQVTIIDQLIEQLLADDGPDSDYNIKVWVSGAYLKLAGYLFATDQELAEKYLKLAEKLIASDQRLKIRQAECQRLEQQLLSPKQATKKSTSGTT